jgi:mannose-1-phosphate guanylyltransferase
VKTVAVIPAGGAGTRLWPRSRAARPKHVLPFAEKGRPLLPAAYERARSLVDEVFVVTEARQRDIVRGVLPALDDRHLILEPSARGTTNAYGLAALTLVDMAPRAVMVAMPADHIVHGAPEIKRAVRTALATASSTATLVTVGLKPTFPSTGLGYIHAPGRARGGTLPVRRFIEKPDAATAARFVRDGGYYWNLAWFSWQLEVFLDELQRYAPRHLSGLRRVIAARQAGDERAATRLYGRLPVEVIDRSIMEKTERLRLVPATFDWADIGNWAELGDRIRADTDGNSVEGEAVLIDTTGTLVFGDRRLIAAIGLEDMIVVDSDDALLIVPRSRAQDVRRVVDALKRARKTRYL